MRPVVCTIAATLALVVLLHPAEAATCTANDFAVAVDQSAASLRALTLEAQPKLQDRMRRYKAAKKLGDDAYENTALDAIRDKKLDDLDKKSSDLLLTVELAWARRKRGAPRLCQARTGQDRGRRAQ